MKRSKKILILLIVLMLAITGYALISKFAAKSEEASSDSETGEQLTNFSADSVADLAWSYDGKTYELSKTDDTWYNAADKDFPVKQSYPSTMTTQISSITASRTLEDVTDLSEYGLDHPSLSVTLTTDTAGKLTFVFGDQNSVTGEYYMQYSEGETLEQNQKVYLVAESVITAFSYRMDQLVQFESLPDLSDINSVKIEANETYRINNMGSDDAVPWVLRDADGNKYPANATLCESLLSTIASLSFEDCVSYNAAEANLADFGLENPWAKITVDYTVKSTSSSSESSDSSEADAETDTLTLSLGDVDENGDVYIMADSMRMIYTVSSDLADWIKQNNVTSIQNLSATSSETVENAD